MAGYKLLDVDRAPDRRIAVAVELWDPIEARPVWRRIEPKLGDRDRKPIVNGSGRFVWLGQPDIWPAAISVDMRGQPFESIENMSLVALKPPGWPIVTPTKRLIRIPLTPTAAYPFQGQIAGIRGDLYEPDAADPEKRKPVTDATVWLEWFDEHDGEFKGGEEITKVKTTDRGNFAVFVRVPRAARVEPDVEKGLLLVQLVFERGGETKVTPDTHRFLPAPAPASRIDESGAMEQWTSVNWKEL